MEMKMKSSALPPPPRKQLLFLCQSQRVCSSNAFYAVSYAITISLSLPTASLVSSKMNFSMHPCEDFYQFACGRFEKTVIIPEDSGSVNTINMIEGRVMAQLHTILNNEIDSREIRPFQMAKKFYRQCMNTSKSSC